MGAVRICQLESLSMHDFYYIFLPSINVINVGVALVPFRLTAIVS